MVSFSPGWNLALPTGLTYCCDYMFNFSPGAKRKFPWESLLRCVNTVNAHARVPFSTRAEIPFGLHETFSDFQARLAGLKILARFEHTGLGFSARTELLPGLNPSPCNRQFGFLRILFQKPVWNFSPGWNSPCNQALSQSRMIFILPPIYLHNLSQHTSSQPITAYIYQWLFYLSIANQGFWIFDWLRLSLDSEDGFPTGCQSQTIVLLRTPILFKYY